MKPNSYGDGLSFIFKSIEEEEILNFKRCLNFKLACVLEGHGTHYFQKTANPFKSGDIFIVAPNEEKHSLAALEATHLFFVDFSSLFIASDGKEKSKTNLLQLLQYANHTPNYIVRLRENSFFLRQLIDAIIRESQSYEPGYSSEYVNSLVYTILVAVGEQIKSCLPKDFERHFDQRIASMLHYIHQNIFSPEKLTTYELSRKFFVSQAYIGRYFKNNTGNNLHQYILLYKIRLIENRLVNSSMRINEIAEEFGFSDKSYLNKLFIRFNGMSPLAYRKNSREAVYNFQEHAVPTANHA